MTGFDTASLLELTIRMLTLVVLISLPVVVVTVVVGLLVGMLQAVTQIQDQSIAHGAKILAAVVTIALLMPWAGGLMHDLVRGAFEMILQARR
jgi:type III secretory pathway component EscS